MSFKRIEILKRIKSDSDLARYRGLQSGFNSLPWGLNRGNRSASETSADGNVGAFSGSDLEYKAGDELGGLEKKLERLSEMLLDQCRLLTEIKEEIRDSRSSIEKSDYEQSKFITDLLKLSLSENSTTGTELEPVTMSSEPINSRARSLLDAIEIKHGCLDRELKVALVDCLQSEELKESMVTEITSSIRGMLGENFSREMSRLYVPMLHRAHRRLARQLTHAIEDAFAELESNSARLSNSMFHVTRSLRRALERHQALTQAGEERFSYIQYIIEDTLQKEIQQCRHLVVEALSADPQNDDVSSSTDWAERGATPPLEYPVGSPPQPADAGCSIIDQLMTVAEINKQIQDGDINTAFESALSAADLALVMAACRAADPSQVFTPCQLKQSTLLSLAQQLPTDMVHDTQLKCRYLEEALINLDLKHPVTNTHLPLVVGEIRKHLTNFLTKYPSHIASRRIALIIMAADNLLK